MKKAQFRWTIGLIIFAGLAFGIACWLMASAGNWGVALVILAGFIISTIALGFTLTKRRRQ